MTMPADTSQRSLGHSSHSSFSSSINKHSRHDRGGGVGRWLLVLVLSCPLPPALLLPLRLLPGVPKVWLCREGFCRPGQQQGRCSFAESELAHAGETCTVLTRSRSGSSSPTQPPPRTASVHSTGHAVAETPCSACMMLRSLLHLCG